MTSSQEFVPTIICWKCGFRYKVRWAHSRRLLDYRMDFSKCPQCKTPRNEKLSEEYKGRWRCCICGLPEPYAQKKGADDVPCNVCYMKRYRANNTLRQKKI